MYYHLIVYLNIRDSDGDCLIKSRRNLVINLSYCPRYYASVLVFSARAGHGESLSSASLSVAHDCSVVSLDSRCYQFLCACFINLILTILITDWDVLTLSYSKFYRI